MPVLTNITQEDFVADVRTLASILARDAWRPDVIVGIGRGGLVPAVFLSHATGLPMLSLDYSSRVPELVAESLVRLAARSRAGERLLLVDDINDSGRTITALRAALTDADAATANIRFATLIDNIRSAERVDYAARAIDRAIVKDWFVFPWEAVAPRAAIDADAAAVPERTA